MIYNDNIIQENPYIFFIIGLFMLVLGSDRLIENSKSIASKFNISKTVIGITIVAFGTSLPELIVSIFAAIKNENAIIVGNIVGSNIANIGLVLGILVLFRTIVIKTNYKRMQFNMIILFIATSLLIVLLATNYLNTLSGTFFVVLFILYIYYLFKYYLTDEEGNSEVDTNIKYYSFIYLIIFIVFSCILVSFGSDFFIKGTIGISSRLGFNNHLVISMTLVALGTSLPELATSLVAIRKGETRMAIGNIIGSNIINILLVIGISSIISNNFIFKLSNILPHLSILLVITLALIFIITFYRRIGRLAGLFFIILYILFVCINFI